MPAAMTRLPDPRGIVVGKRSGGESLESAAPSQQWEYPIATAGPLQTGSS